MSIASYTLQEIIWIHLQVGPKSFQDFYNILPKFAKSTIRRNLYDLQDQGKCQQLGQLWVKENES